MKVMFSRLRSMIGQKISVMCRLTIKSSQKKLILRKSDKNDNIHWSRCFVIISYIIVALLIAAIVVWIAGLIVTRNILS